MAKNRSGRRGALGALPWWLSLILSITLSVGTWNPSGMDFVHYVSGDLAHIFSGFKPFIILIVLVLWLLAIKSISQSLGFVGAVISLVVIAAFAWGLQQSGIVDFTNITEAGWLATISMGLLIWLGLNASILWKKLTGVYATEHTESESDFEDN